jgi:DNA-binding NtrC family response regulator
MTHRNTRVFIVDDEPIIASTLAAILRLSGYEAISFNNPLDALKRAPIDRPTLLISDVVMPQLSGIDLAVQVKALCPACKVLLFSGSASYLDFAHDAERLDHHFHILPKPIYPGDLLRAIQEQDLEN